MENHTKKIVEYLYEEYKYVEFDEDNSIEENIKKFKESIYFSVMMLKHKGNEQSAIDEMLKLFYGDEFKFLWSGTMTQENEDNDIEECERDYLEDMEIWNTVDIEMNHQDVVQDLKEYFYNNQYDEERYPHFRACDRTEDIINSLSSKNGYVYTFYY